jgi:hypothetical protein
MGTHVRPSRPCGPPAEAFELPDESSPALPKSLVESPLPSRAQWVRARTAERRAFEARLTALAPVSVQVVYVDRWIYETDLCRARAHARRALDADTAARVAGALTPTYRGPGGDGALLGLALERARELGVEPEAVAMLADVGVRIEVAA